VHATPTAMHQRHGARAPRTPERGRGPPGQLLEAGCELAAGARQHPAVNAQTEELSVQQQDLLLAATPAPCSVQVEDAQG